MMVSYYPIHSSHKMVVGISRLRKTGTTKSDCKTVVQIFKYFYHCCGILAVKQSSGMKVLQGYQDDKSRLNPDCQFYCMTISKKVSMLKTLEAAIQH